MEHYTIKRDQMKETKDIVHMLGVIRSLSVDGLKHVCIYVAQVQ